MKKSNPPARPGSGEDDNMDIVNVDTNTQHHGRKGPVPKGEKKLTKKNNKVCVHLYMLTI